MIREQIRRTKPGKEGKVIWKRQKGYHLISEKDEIWKLFFCERIRE